MPNGFTSSAIDYGDFYRGSMQPPVIANGLPTQSAVGTRVERVTPEGLNVNRVQTVAVDPFTGNPIQAGGTTAPRTAAVLSRAPGQMTAQASPAYVPGPSGTTVLNKDPGRLEAGSSLAYNGDQNTGIPAVAAITRATSPGAAWGGGWGADAIGRFLAGDPGRVDFGVVNGDNGQYGIPAQGFATIPNGPPTVPTVRSVIAARAAAQPPATMASNLNPGVTRFLEQQGQSTQGMTAGEEANALRNEMGGSHNGEFH